MLGDQDMYNWSKMFDVICQKYSGETLKTKYGDLMEKFVKKLKIADKELYDDLMDGLYVLVFGEHFNEETAKEAVSCMVNDDGTTGEHWNIEETTAVAKQNNIVFGNFNQFDWYYTLNMVYSDFSKVFGSNTEMYIKVAKSWLEDKDAPKGKAYKYYKMTKEQGVNV